MVHYKKGKKLAIMTIENDDNMQEIIFRKVEDGLNLRKKSKDLDTL